jgi:aryl-alcohol dehydrogenase-like predicted oxidoreductase
MPSPMREVRHWQKWRSSGSEVTSVLIGASKVEQIEENVKALHTTTFSETEFQAIDEITLGPVRNSTEPSTGKA